MPDEHDLTETIVPALMALLDRGPKDPNVTALESLAANLVLAIEHPEMDEELPETLAAALEKRGDEVAAGVLAGLVAFGTPRVAQPSQDALQRSAFATRTQSIGTLRVQEAALIESPGVELLTAVLERPGRNKVQALILGIDSSDEGEGALATAMLTPPMAPVDARAVLNIQHSTDETTRRALEQQELGARAIAAAARTVELGKVLPHAPGTALPIISRALTGDPGALERPEMLSPYEDDDEELIVDEQQLVAVSTQLLEEFAGYLGAGDFTPEQCAAAPIVAGAMLQWKGGYADGHLGRWTADNLAGFMQAYKPTHAAERVVVPAHALTFLNFLQARGSLSGENLERLAHACEALAKGTSGPPPPPPRKARGANGNGAKPKPKPKRR